MHPLLHSFGRWKLEQIHPPRLSDDVDCEKPRCCTQACGQGALSIYREVARTLLRRVRRYYGCLIWYAMPQEAENNAIARE